MVLYKKTKEVIIVLVTKKVLIKWNKANKKHYRQLGYLFTNYGDEFEVRVQDLQPNASVRVTVICDFCQREYSVTWQHYIEVENKNQKHACYNCRHIKRYENNLHKRQDELYLKALQACQQNGYVLLSSKFDILCNTSYIKYLCPRHGEHTMRVSNFINGKGCPDCVPENNSERFRLSVNEVEQRIQECGGKLLNKNDYINRHERNLLVECCECKTPFVTSLVLFTQHGGQVCDACRNSESLGEKRIECYLQNNQIKFVPQQCFSDCRDQRPLPFDFYLPDYNTLIEFDGRQHFEDTHYFTYPIDMVRKHDEIKNNYCQANGINLIRIPYWDINQIEQILNKELIIHEDIV